MMRKTLAILVPLAAGCTAVAQDTPARPTFDVASVKPAAAGDAAHPMMAQMMARAAEGMYANHPPGWLPLRKTRLTMKNRTLAGLIASAYRVRAVQVSGPAWMADALFEIEATMPAGTTVEMADEMLPSRGAGVRGLRAGGSEGRAEADARGRRRGAEGRAGGEDARKAQGQQRMAEMMKRMQEMRKANAADGETGNFSSRWFQDNDIPVQRLADWLAAWLGKPVIDQTALEGRYDIDVQVLQRAGDTAEYGAAQAAAKLGLKLEARKATLPVIVVEKVERTPTGN